MKAPNWPQMFENLAAEQVPSGSDETEEKLEEDDENIDYDQVPSLVI